MVNIIRFKIPGITGQWGLKYGFYSAFLITRRKNFLLFEALFIYAI